MMRFFVCSGMDRAAGELFRAAETVPGVRPRWSAMVLRVTRGSGRRGCFFLDDWVIYRILRASTKRRFGQLYFLYAPSARRVTCADPSRRFGPLGLDRMPKGPLSGARPTPVSGHARLSRLFPSPRDLARYTHPKTKRNLFFLMRRQTPRGRITLFSLRISIFLLDKRFAI